MPTATLLRICGLIAILLLLPGCRPLPGRTAGEPAATLNATLHPASPSRSAANVILPSELQRARVANAYDAIARLRPEFFQRRGLQTAERPNGQLASLFVDDVEEHEFDTLRTIPVARVLEIRYLTAAQATAKFGSNHSGGVIAVRSRR